MLAFDRSSNPGNHGFCLHMGASTVDAVTCFTSFWIRLGKWNQEDCTSWFRSSSSCKKSAGNLYLLSLGLAIWSCTEVYYCSSGKQIGLQYAIPTDYTEIHSMSLLYSVIFRLFLAI